MQHSKTYLNVPYAQKDAAKALGAKWDPAKKQWFAPGDIDITLFAKWHTQSGTLPSPATSRNRLKPPTSAINSGLSVTTYGKNKDLSNCNGDEPPWD